MAAKIGLAKRFTGPPYELQRLGTRTLRACRAINFFKPLSRPVGLLGRVNRWAAVDQGGAPLVEGDGEAAMVTPLPVDMQQTLA